MSELRDFDSQKWYPRPSAGHRRGRKRCFLSGFVFLLREIYIRKKGKGSALNEGIRRARNDLVCVLDADCILQEDALSKAVKHFRNYEVVAVGGRLLVKREDSSQLEAIDYCIKGTDGKEA